jgi:hypothetical protein
LYRHLAGPDISSVPAITPEERDTILRVARSLTEVPAAEHKQPPAAGGNRPGDDFNDRATWLEILLPHGWTHLGESNGLGYVRRTGKDDGGCSATFGLRSESGKDLLYVFSSNAHPFEPNRSYTKFAAYALLNHGGDFAAAARALGQAGYGDPKKGPTPSRGAPPPDAPREPDEPAGLATTRLDGVRPQPVRWEVRDYVARGKLVMLAGDGGHGKSCITLHMTACLTRGWPCFGLDYQAEGPADVLLVNCEDDMADTVVPRLLAAGADLTRVYQVNGIKTRDGKAAPFSLAHYQRLEEELQARPDVRLVIIDPAGAYIGKTDDHKDSELRGLLGPLSELAATRQVTILLVKHLNKGANPKAVYKVNGSVGYVNTVRAAFLTAPDAEDEGLKYFLPIKFNLGPKPAGLSYRLEALPEEQRLAILSGLTHLTEEDRERLGKQLFHVKWLGPVTVEADAVLAAGARKERAGAKDVDVAAEWLGKYLDQRPRRSEHCVAEGNKALGLAKDLKWWRESVLKSRLHGKPRKTGFGDGQRWWFTLPRHPWLFPGLEEGEEGEEGEEFNDEKPGSRADSSQPDAFSDRDDFNSGDNPAARHEEARRKVS